MEVYKGYVIHRSFSLQELHELVSPYRQKVQAASVRIASKVTAGIVVDVVDHMTVYQSVERAMRLLQERYGQKINPTHNAIAAAYEIMLTKENRVKTIGKRDSRYDLLCKIHFYPLADKTLCWLDAEQDEYVVSWEQVPGVIPYPYYPCETPPDGISAEAWSQRQIEWRSATARSQEASLNAITIECINSFPDFDWNTIMESIKPLEKRIRSKAKDSLMEKRYREMVKDGDERIDWGLSIDIFEWMSCDPEGAEALAAECEIIKDRFTQTLTRADLMTPLADLVPMEVAATYEERKNDQNGKSQEFVHEAAHL